MTDFLKDLENHKVLIAILLAFIGYLVKYFHDLNVTKRKSRLERANSQLRDLYGPLYALVFAADAAWKTFREKHRPGGAFFKEDDPPNDKDVKAWHLWMTSVFMPLNRKMVEAITSNADLLEGEMPEEFLSLISHVAAYEPVLKQWEDGIYTDHTSQINFPSTLKAHVEKMYQDIKQKQLSLL